MNNHLDFSHLASNLKHNLERNQANIDRNTLAQLSQLTEEVAHEYNNLLSIIVGAVQLVELMGVDDDAKEHLSLAYEAIDQAELLTEKLLDLSNNG